MRTLLLLVLALAACTEDEGRAPDATADRPPRPDTGLAKDAGPADGGVTDTGVTPDAGSTDAAPNDAAPNDATPGDADPGDADPGDAGDAGFADARSPDATFPDLGLPDGALPDFGLGDVGIPDVAFPDAAVGCTRGSCPVDAYCATPLGMCDGTGVCVQIPVGLVCPQVFDPVCGCDGNTYGNACEAYLAGVAVDTLGQCP